MGILESNALLRKHKKLILKGGEQKKNFRKYIFELK